MRYLTIIGTFAFFIALIPSLLTAENVIDDTKNPRYLYVISGTSGSLEGDKLILNGVPNVVYFSDRPARQAGHMSLSKFVGMWNKGSESFKADPPNAVLSIQSKGGNKNIVVELLDPIVRKNDIEFKINILNGNVQKEFQQSSLFIDDGGEGGAAGIFGTGGVGGAGGAF